MQALVGDRDEQHPSVAEPAGDVPGTFHVVEEGEVAGPGFGDRAVAALVLGPPVEGDTDLGLWPVVPTTLVVCVGPVVATGHEGAVRRRPVVDGRNRRHGERPSDRL